MLEFLAPVQLLLAATDAATTEPAAPNLLGTIFTAVASLLGVGLLGVMGLLGKWINEKSNATAMGRVWLGAWELVQSTVAHIEVNLRPTLASVLADGKVTREEGAKLRDEALRLIKEALGTKGLAQVQRYFGPVEVFLSGLIERALGTQRKAGTLPPPAPANTPRP